MVDNRNILTKSKDAFGWDLIGTFAKQLGSFVISIILARLLSPEDFGIIGISMVFISITQVFIDVGFTDGIIQRKEISERMISSIFFINVAISFILSGLIYLSAHQISLFFENPEIQIIVQWLAILPIVGAFGNVQAALLQRQMQFKELTIRVVLSTVLGGIVGILAALYDYGVYSLVAQQITFAVIGVILLWIGSDWRPSWVFSFKEVKSLLSFSGYIFLDQGLRQISQRLDTLFVGKFFSPATLGYFSRAESLNSQVLDYTATSLRRIIFPLFSSIQDNEEQFKSIYYQAFSLISTISVFLAGLLYFLAEPIILLLFGEKWAPSVIFFEILVFRTLLAPFGGLMTRTILSKGLAKLKFQLSLFQRVILFLPLVLGYFLGIIWFTWMIIISFFLVFLTNAWFLDKRLGISFNTQVSGFLISIAPMVLIIAMFSILNFSNPFFCAGIYAISQILIWVLFQDKGFMIIKHQLSKTRKNK